MTHPYGPWATLITAGQNPQLSAFWRRRLRMLVPVSQTSSKLSRRNVIALIIAAISLFLLPTFRAAPIVAQQRPAASDGAPLTGDASSRPAATVKESQSRPADDREAAERLWSARYTLVDGTPCYIPPDMAIFFMPFNLGQLGSLAEFHLSDAQKENLRQICGEYMKQKHEAHVRAEKDGEKVSPREREARSKQMRDDYLALDRTFGKRIDQVLTRDQQAAVKHAMLENEALVVLMGIVQDPRGDERLQLHLSDPQRRQLAKLFTKRAEQRAQDQLEYPDKLLEVLSPQQRAKLLEGIDDKAPQVHVAPFRDASSQVTYTAATLAAAPDPFYFCFNSPADAWVDVYCNSRLDDAATRKQLRLSDAQEAKLRAIHVAAEASADRLFKTYELDYDALKRLPLKAQQEKRAAYEAKLSEFRQKLTDFGNDTRRQIEAVFDAQQLAAMRRRIRISRALSALMSRERKTRDALDATGLQREKLLDLAEKQRDHNSFQRQTGAETLKILTPQQRQKLVDDIVQQGG
jgi:Spy/CpxP family protein refolding chaperone